MQELIKKQEELQEQLAALAEEIKNYKEPKIFPQENEKYWGYNAYGTIYNCIAGDSSGRVGVYKTEEKAKADVYMQWAKQRVVNAIEIANEGWSPTWGDEGEYKYSFALTANSNIITVWSPYKEQPSNMVCKSKEIAEEIAKKYEDDLFIIFSE